MDINLNNNSNFEHNILNINKCNNCQKTEQECRKTDQKLRKCSACLMMKYCSIECQKTNWSTHKIECVSLIQEREDKKNKEEEYQVYKKTKEKFEEICGTTFDSSFFEGQDFLKNEGSNKGAILKNFLLYEHALDTLEKGMNSKFLRKEYVDLANNYIIMNHTSNSDTSEKFPLLYLEKYVKAVLIDNINDMLKFKINDHTPDEMSNIIKTAIQNKFYKLTEEQISNVQKKIPTILELGNKILNPQTVRETVSHKLHSWGFFENAMICANEEEDERKRFLLAGSIALDISKTDYSFTTTLIEKLSLSQKLKTTLQKKINKVKTKIKNKEELKRRTNNNKIKKKK